MNEIIRTAVGPDLSRPPPIYRPVADCSASRSIWFICIIGPYGVPYLFTIPRYFVKEHDESLLRWLRMFLRSIRIAVRIMNSCLFKITRRAQACNWNFWLACAGDLLGQRFPNRGRSLKACAIATKYGIEILVTRYRPK